MEAVVDRVEFSQVLTVRAAVVVPEAAAAPTDVASPRTPQARSARPWAARASWRTIPSVVRALLVGYDEV